MLCIDEGGGYFFARKLHITCIFISLCQKQKFDRIYTTDNKEGKYDI